MANIPVEGSTDKLFLCFQFIFHHQASQHEDARRTKRKTVWEGVSASPATEAGKVWLHKDLHQGT